MIYSREEINQADSMEIVSMLNSLGEPIRKVGQYYETKAHDSLRISGNKYYWNSRGTNGKTIKFIMEYFGYSFTDAVGRILDKTGRPAIAGLEKKKCGETSSDTIPLWDNDLLAETSEKRRAIAYLCKSRMIGYEIVIEMIKKGIVGQDKYGCVLFKALDKKGDVVGAERRGTAAGSRFRQTVQSTNPHYGVSLTVGEPHSLFAFESAIDMISFYELYSKKLADSVLVSMRGLKLGLIEATLSRYGINQGNSYLCVDDDEAGTNFIKRTRQKYPEIKAIAVGDGHKDWNEMLVARKMV